MATIQDATDLSLNSLTLYCATDDYLSTVLIYHGPVTTTAATSSSRIQLVIFTLAGHHSFPRLTLSPTSPLYAAVNHLPREKQGDEICRGLAVGLLKYFAELPDPVKSCLSGRAKKLRGGGKIPRMFDEMHAAEIANRMEKVENASEVTAQLKMAYPARGVSWLDMDVVLPQNSIKVAAHDDDLDHDAAGQNSTETSFGQLAPIVNLFGDPVFIPTSRLRKAPSRPTNLSKSRQFTRQQKEALRLAMCEAVDTEERYVSKIYELVYAVAEEFRAKARTKSIASSSPGEDALSKLFPPCLDQILEVNMGFLNAIRLVLEETEQEAMDDIASSAESTIDGRKRKDPLGALAFGKVLKEWFPRFAQPYRDYMQVQSGFAKLLNLFMKDQASSFSKRIQQTGEQRLRSMLMEPVQRLPRYSLLIDAMTSTLPSSHIALRPLLRARDLITEICALDSPGDNDEENSLKRLQRLVKSWPKSLDFPGRLVTVLDAIQSGPGQTTLPDSGFNTQVMILLFPGQLLFLGKEHGCQLSARGLQAEMDKRSRTSTDNSTVLDSSKLLFLDSVRLASVQISQSTCGNNVYLAYPELGSLSQGSSSPKYILRSFRLAGSDQGKASRFLEECMKARVEHHFPEEERESGKWTLLASPSSPSSLDLMAAICEEGPCAGSRREAPSVVFYLDGRGFPATELSKSSQILASASLTTGGRYKIEIRHSCGKSTDVVSLEDLKSAMLKRLSSHLKTLHSVQNPSLVEATIQMNEGVHQSLEIRFAAQAKTSRGFRPASPSKLLSSWWSGPQVADSGKLDHNTALKNIPSIPPPAQNPKATSLQREDSYRIIAVNSGDGADVVDPISQLEQILTSYVLALRSRRGNIVGRSLRGRAHADQVAVNDLYNVLLEDASRIQAAAEVSVDVLVAAFEKFLTYAWKEKLGPILSPGSIQTLQARFERHFPADFEKFFKEYLTTMAPQNKRAFTAMIRLLTDLLDASGNDGDRGALTATFAELLTESPHAMQFISLLDRLVEDYERLFDDSTPIGWPEERYVGQDNEVSSGLLLKNKNGSISSQTSSFRKRFGFGLSRHNSKDESESKVSSLIRSLSKTKGSSEPSSQPSSLSRATLVRSRSTDSDSKVPAFLRPISRDKSGFSTLTFEEHAYSSRPGSAHSTIQMLQSIGEDDSKPDKLLTKKKRRSSLSDLKSLHDTMKDTHITPLPLRTTPKQDPIAEVAGSSSAPTDPEPVPVPKSLPTPAASASRSPTKADKAAPAIVTKPTIPRIGSPTRTSPRKENIKSPTPQPKSSSPVKSPTPNLTSPRVANLASPRAHLAERNLNRLGDNITSPKKRLDTQSSIPTPRSGTVRERPSIANGKASASPTKRVPSISSNSNVSTSPTKPRPSSTTQPPPKLKLQSTTKLRERLSREKQSFTTQTTSFQTELANIGEELSSLTLEPLPESNPSKPETTIVRSSSPSRPKSSSTSTATSSLSTRLTSLSSTLSTLSQTTTTKLTTLESDTLKALSASERKVRQLDQLYKEATRENEALYERFNKELARVAKGGEPELRRLVEGLGKEVEAVRRENWALRRDGVGEKEGVAADEKR
ncbi:MAG: hypothetical protein Q9227_004451 [Pyrenula ochraceoflavens]